MSKNVIWWVGVKNEQYSEKYGGWEWLDYSRKTWEYWCKKNDVLFVPFEKPIEEDLTKFRINWQKAIFVFDELDRRNIDYDQICLVDCASMIKWDTPNFFEMTEHKLTAWRDMENMRWIYESIQGYEDLFQEANDLPHFKLDQSKYVNSSPMIFNKSHKDLFLSFKEFYYDYIDIFIKLQDEVVKKGTEQTPLNYWLQINKVDVNIDLPISFKLSHLHRKELLRHNWQLNEDTTPFFIKYGHIWYFQGFAKDQRTNFMKQTWNLIKDNYEENDEILLNSVRHKDKFRLSTSRKFKEDLLNIFKDDKFKKMNCVELGCCHGDSTKVLSKIFKSVHAVDWEQENIDRAKDMCKGCYNITYQVSNVSEDEWDYPDAEVVFIDASHDYPQVAYDIEKAKDYFKDPIIILDDYGNPNNKAIRKAIDEKVKDETLTIDKFIGEKAGFKTKSEWIMDDREGVICYSNFRSFTNLKWDKEKGTGEVIITKDNAKLKKSISFSEEMVNSK